MEPEIFPVTDSNHCTTGNTALLSSLASSATTIIGSSSNNGGINSLSMEDVLQIIHETSQHNLLILAKSATGKPLKGAAKSKAQAKAINSILTAVEAGYFVQALLAGEGRPLTPSTPSSPSSLLSVSPSNQGTTTSGIPSSPLSNSVTTEPTTSSILGFAPGITLTKLAYQTFCTALTQSMGTALQSLRTVIQETVQAKYMDEIDENNETYPSGYGTMISNDNFSLLTNTGSVNAHHLHRKRRASMDHAHYHPATRTMDHPPPYILYPMNHDSLYASVANKNNNNSINTYNSSSESVHHSSPLMKGSSPFIPGAPSSPPLHSSIIMNGPHNLMMGGNQISNSSTPKISSSPFHNHQYRSLPFPSAWLSSTLLKQQRRQHSNSITSHGSSNSNDEQYGIPIEGDVPLGGSPSSLSRINRVSFDSIVTPTNKARITSIHMERTPLNDSSTTSTTNNLSSKESHPYNDTVTNDPLDSLGRNSQFVALPSPNRSMLHSPHRKYSITSEKHRYTDSQYYRQLLELLSSTSQVPDVNENYDDTTRSTTVDQYGYYRSSVRGRSYSAGESSPHRTGSLYTNDSTSSGTTLSSVGPKSTDAFNETSSNGTDSGNLNEITVFLFPCTMDSPNIRLPLTFGLNSRPVPRYSLSAVNDMNITNPIYYTAYRLKYGYFVLDGYQDSAGSSNSVGTSTVTQRTHSVVHKKPQRSFSFDDDNNHMQQWCIMRDTTRTNKDGYDVYIWAQYTAAPISSTGMVLQQPESTTKSLSTPTIPHPSPNIKPLLTNLDWTDIQWYSTGVSINNQLSYRLIGIQYLPLSSLP